MRYSELVETIDLRFHTEARGFHHGQSDLTLQAWDGETLVGTIEYSTYGGEVHIQMIEAGRKRQGIGSALVRELQRQYPEQELDWGGMTDDGAALYRALPKTEVTDPDLQAKADRLASLRAAEADLQAKSDAFYAEPRTEAEIAAFGELCHRWNDLNDEIAALKRELDGRKTTRMLIRPRTT